MAAATAPPTVLTCGNMRLTLPPAAAIPKLDLRPHNAVAITFQSFSGTVTFETVASTSSSTPMHSSASAAADAAPPLASHPVSPPASQPLDVHAHHHHHHHATLAQTLDTHLLDPQPSHAVTDSYLQFAPSQVRPAVLPLASPMPEEDDPRPGHVVVDATLSQSQSQSQSQSPAQSQALSQPHGLSQAPQHSQSPSQMPQPHSQPALHESLSQTPLSQHYATQHMPETQLPDSQPLDSQPLDSQPLDSQPLDMANPPISAYTAAMAAPMSPPSSQDSELSGPPLAMTFPPPPTLPPPSLPAAAVSDSTSPSKKPTPSKQKSKPAKQPKLSKNGKPLGRPRGRPPKVPKSLKPALPHPSALSRVDSRPKHGKRVRFEDDVATVLDSPPRKKGTCANGARGRDTGSPVSDEDHHKAAEKAEEEAKNSNSDSANDPKSVKEEEEEPVPTPVTMPVSAVTAAAAVSPWRPVEVAAAARPPHRWGATLTRMEDQTLLLVGGESEARGMLRDMHAYNAETGVWLSDAKHAPPLPSPRAWHTTVRIGQSVLVFGGEVEQKGADGREERQQTNDALVYDTTYLTWYAPSLAGTGPSARAGHCAAVIPGTRDVAVYGGIYKNKWLNDLHVLEDMSEWGKVRTSLKNVRPSARSYATLTAVGEYAVLFGGNNSTRCFNDVHLLGKGRTWTEPVILSRAPRPRTGHCAVAAKDGSGVIVYGGWDDQGEKRLFFSDVWLLRVKSATECQWTCLYAGNSMPNTAPPGPRAGAAMCEAAEGEDVLLFGGWHHCSYYNDLFKLDLGTDGLKPQPSAASPAR